LTFEEGYFVQSEKSNYEDYRRKKFDALAKDLQRILKIHPDTKILDFGCATGGLLKSLKELGFKHLKGTDISYWAIDYGKKFLGLEDELEFHNVNLLCGDFDIVFFLDVLEHVPSVEEIKKFLELVKVGVRVLIRVPVSAREGEPYVFEVSRNDQTHVQCHTRYWWADLLYDCGYRYLSIMCGKAIYDSDGVYAALFEKEVEERVE
jgi:2-polyprenyl-3-methyl-5-hydroxy-6-metoxy-1,4-benzoquinol methylase